MGDGDNFSVSYADSYSPKNKHSLKFWILSIGLAVLGIIVLLVLFFGLNSKEDIFGTNISNFSETQNVEQNVSFDFNLSAGESVQNASPIKIPTFAGGGGGGGGSRESSDDSTPTIDIIAPGMIENITLIYQSNDSLAWNWSNPSDGDFYQNLIFIDLINVANVSANSYMASGLNPLTDHIIEILTMDTSGNVNGSVVSSEGTTLETPVEVDTTAPGSVKSLQLAYRTTTSLSWNWTSPGDRDLKEYIIFLNGVNVINTTDIRYSNTSLSPNVAYTIAVWTVDNTGNVNNSDVTRIDSTLPDTTPPAAVTKLGVEKTNESLTWSWVNPSDLDFYQVVIYYDGHNVLNESVDIYSASNLQQGSTHNITVYTKDKNGNVNSNGVFNSATTTVYQDVTPPAAITGLTVLSRTTNNITWIWTNPSVDFSLALISIDSTNVQNITGNNFTRAFSPGTSHTISIRTRDGSGNVNVNAVSNVSATLPDTNPPGTISNLASTKTNTTITWTWTNPTDSDFNYTIIYYDGANLINQTATSYSVSNLQQGSTHTINIFTRDIYGNINSNGISSSVTTDVYQDVTPPAAITGLTVLSRTTNNITWIWTNPSVDFSLALISIDSINVQNITGNNFTRSFSPGTSHTISIRTRDGSGNVNVNAVSNVSATLPDTTAPGTISNLASSKSNTSITWTWSNPTDSDFNYTIIYYDGANLINQTATSYSVSNLQQGSTHTINIFTRDIYGNINSNGISSSVTTDVYQDVTPPAAITGLTVLSRTTNNITWIWTNPSVDFGQVIISVDGTNLINTTSNNYTKIGLNPGTSHTISIKTKDISGNVNVNAVSNVSATLPDVTPPATITNLRVTSPGNTQIGWSWDNPLTDFSTALVYLNGANKGNTSSGFYTATTTPGLVYNLTVFTMDSYNNINWVPVTNITKAYDYAPSTPVNFRTTGATESSIGLAWNASTDDKGINAYYIYRNGAYIATVSSSTLTYTDSGLTYSTSYNYSIKAQDTAYQNSSLVSVMASTSGDVTPPVAITGLTVLSRTTNNITWIWTNPSVDFGQVIISVDGTNLINTTSNNYTKIGLNPGTSHTISIKTKDVSGNVNVNAVSNVSATLPDVTPPLSVSGLYVLSPLSNRNISWAWTNPSNDFYQAIVYFDNVNKINTSSSNYSAIGLAPGSVHNLTVYTKDVYNNINWVPVTNITKAQDYAPSTPVSFRTTTVTDSSIGLAWNASTDDIGVIAYHIYRNSVFIATTSGLTYSDNGLNYSTSYTYTIKAQDTLFQNSSLASVIGSTSGDATPPAAITGLAMSSRTASSIVWSWTNPLPPTDFSEAIISIDGVNEVNTTLNTYTKSNLAQNSSHTISIRTKDARGNVNSTIISSTDYTLPDTTPPSGVKGVTYTRTNTGIVWSWTNPSTDFSQAIIYLDNVNKVNISANTYNASNLGPGTSHNLTIYTMDLYNNINRTAVTSIVSTLDYAPSPPATLTLKSVGFSSAFINWSASTDDVGISGYLVYRNGVFIASTANNILQYNNTGLNASTQYSYTVKANDTINQLSSASPSLTVNTLGDSQFPTAPTNLVATAVTSNSVSLSWSSSTDDVGVVGYMVFRNGNNVANVSA